MDTQARRPSLASVVGTRERERREIPHDVSSDPARQRLHFDPAKPCLGRAGRECPGSRRRRLEADVGDVSRPRPRTSWRPRESHPRVIPDYPGLSRLNTFDRPHCARSRAAPKGSLVRTRLPHETIDKFRKFRLIPWVLGGALVHESEFARPDPDQRRFTDRCRTTLACPGRSSDSGGCTRGVPRPLALLECGLEGHPQ